MVNDILIAVTAARAGAVVRSTANVKIFPAESRGSCRCCRSQAVARRRVDVRFKTAMGRQMAVRVRFELTEPVKVQRFSRPPHSTTLPPHRSRVRDSIVAKAAMAYGRALPQATTLPRRVLSFHAMIPRLLAICVAAAAFSASMCAQPARDWASLGHAPEISAGAEIEARTTGNKRYRGQFNAADGDVLVMTTASGEQRLARPPSYECR